MENHMAYSNQYFLVGIGMVSRKHALKIIYRHSHRDRKGTIDGYKTILALREAGTCLVPLDALTDEEVTAQLPYAIQKETERVLAKSARLNAKNADSIDGYDRDDLGESPDY
jgi:hypothetical protein